MAQTRRPWFRLLVSATVALLFMVVAVKAEEIFGILSKVDADHNKITITQKKSDRETVLTVTDETQFVTPKKSGKFVAKRVAKRVEKAQEKGRPGIPVAVTYDDGVASKVEIRAGKKKKKKKDD